MAAIDSDAPPRPPALRRLAWLYGIVCHALFAAGVGAMAVAMYFGMSRCLGRVAAPWSYVANAALLAQFPLGHSLLLARRGGKALRWLAPAGFARDMTTTTYAAVAAAQVALLFAAWTPTGIIWWSAQGCALALLVTLYAASWLLLLTAIVNASFAAQVGLLGWWAVARGVPVRYPDMPERGLFRLCPQPIYVAFALTVWTVPT